MSDVNFNIGNHQIQGGRDYQDDSFSSIEIDENTFVFIMADGMGGYAGGKEASETVIKNFKLYFDKNNPNIKEALYDALLKANEALKQAKEIKPEYSQMGTTFIAMYINQEYAQWISVGDSPLWLIREGEGIKRVNQNHSIAGLLQLQLAHGEITEDDMENSPNKHMLTSAITGEELKSIDRSNPLELKKGDTFLLASDGVESLNLKEIEELVKNSKDNKEAVKMILSAVLQKGVPNQDNATITIVTPTNVKDKIVEEKAPKTTPMPQAKRENNYNNNSLNDVLQVTPKKRNLIQILIYVLSSIVVVLLSIVIYMKLNPNVNKIANTNKTTAQKAIINTPSKKGQDKHKIIRSSTNHKKQDNTKKSNSQKSTKKDINKNTQISKKQPMPSKSVGSDKNNTTKPANTTNNNRDKSDTTKQVVTKAEKNTTVKIKDTKKDEIKSTTKPKVKVTNSTEKTKKIENELYKQKKNTEDRANEKVKAEQQKAKDVEKNNLENRDNTSLETKTPAKEINTDATKKNDNTKNNSTQPNNAIQKDEGIKSKTKEDIKKDVNQNGLVFLKNKLESKFQKEARNNIRVLGVYVIIR